MTNKPIPKLMDEPPITVYPSLAAHFQNVNKAIILQQLHFLLGVTEKAKSKYNLIDGRWWVYNTHEEWQRDHFQWLSISTIKRLLIELEKDGIVLSQQSVKHKSDRRKWYAIDYECLQKILDPSDQNSLMVDETKIVPCNRSKLSDGYTETTTESLKDISPTGETDPEPQKPKTIPGWKLCYGIDPVTGESLLHADVVGLTVEEADNKLFGTRDEPITPDDELLRPTFTTDQMKQLATAYVSGKCPVADHNRELCRVLEKQGYFKIRGRGKNGVSTYKLSEKGKAVCSDPTTALKDLIQLNKDIATRKAENKNKPKKTNKKNGKAPLDITTMPEIQGIAEKLCLIHFGTTYKELTDDNKRTIVSLSHIYRNQGADTSQKVQQVHDHYKSCDWYEGASPFGFTKNLRIAQALNTGSRQTKATDKSFSIEEVD
jgi:DNA-binding PadR family transcriptional regulator